MLEALYKRKKKSRYDTLVYMVVAILLALVARFAYLQIVKSDFYSARAAGNSLRLIPMTAARGVIYDRNGQIIASSRPAFTVSIMPMHRMPSEAEIKKLSQLLQMPENTLRATIEKNKNGYEPIRLATDVGMDVVTKIAEYANDLPGVSIEVEPLRYYPYHEMAAQLLGYVGEISAEELEKERQNDPNTGMYQGSIVGRAGLEAIYDTYLRGSDGGRQVEVDATGTPVAERNQKKTTPGKDVYLTIDWNLQQVAEKAVRDQLAYLQSLKIPAKAATVVAMDPNTGAILAMVSYPSFDPNWFSKGLTEAQWKLLNNDPNHPFDNRAISGQYPPGSPFKIVTAAAALSLNKVTPTELIFDSGRHKLIDKRNAEGEALGWINLNTAIAKSDNVYFYELGLRIGDRAIADYARKFGLGEKTGIKLYGEASGNVASEEYKQKVFNQDWYLGETFDSAIGQSYHLVTPIQMAVFMSEVANGGIRYQPYVVSRINNLDGTPQEIFSPKQIGTLDVSKQVMDVIRQGLRDVAEEGGTAGDLFKGFPIHVAGKTGTAENAHGTEHGWFVAYAPFEKPRIVVVTMVEQGSFGALSAAPIAKAVLAAFFHIQEEKMMEKKKTITNSKNGEHFYHKRRMYGQDYYGSVWKRWRRKNYGMCRPRICFESESL